MLKDYDIIVVGAGHAGSEAAAAAANMGSSVLLITMNLDTIAQMSCNPAMGGVAKGQIIREIDAMGGYSGIVTDKTMIQFRMLNRSKGPAMWSPRAQSDRMLFSAEWRRMLENTPNVDFWQDMVVGLDVRNETVCGVFTKLGLHIKTKSVVLTNGTFLNGLIHIGEKNFTGGRIGEMSASGITENLVELGFQTERLKTGTPVRIDGRSIDFSKLEEQKGDEEPGKFSFSDTKPLTHQRSCWLAYTNDEVHDILKTGFEKSPLFTGRIKGVGPRYCPSIEDKIERFSTKNRHQLFVEPQGWITHEYYLNGFSSSLPEDIQYAALKKISGFENSKIIKPGYAIEYDYFSPTQLKNSLETKFIANLFFAGQINGTTGYEEAGAQGLMAGINAHLKITGQKEFILGRSEAYIGVLIDDLVTKGVDEPYRMFTSRAEYRILLRQDNADIRLTEKSHQIGLATESQICRLNEKLSALESIKNQLSQIQFQPSEINPLLQRLGTAEINQKSKFLTLLLRPQISIKDLRIEYKNVDEIFASYEDDFELAQQFEIAVKYESYIQREKEIADKIGKFENIILSQDLDYHSMQSLSWEAREKLTKIKPSTIGQASRISGVSPSDISVLIVHMGR